MEALDKYVRGGELSFLIMCYLISPRTEIVNGLTRREHLVLLILALLTKIPNAYPFRQKDIGNCARMDRSDVSKVVSSLEKHFIVFRAKDGIRFTTSFLRACLGIE